ncbi:glycine cleavage system protein R [Tundrisphaera lichenicola]|uniref:glycine cleavage system protein R n=1 Tax=Tundrisphaera lichenicola TaxID=2029860 RepID=UPI003EBC62D8
MSRNFVLTLTGPDRIGIVDEVTRLLLDRGGNVETSRMARLGGEFAILMLATMPDEHYAGMLADLEHLTSRGYKATTTEAERTYAEAHPGWAAYRIEVQGADHEGIIHEIAHHLSERGISIESMDSECTPAPTSGAPLFSMSAHVVAPPGLPASDWQAGFREIGGRMNLDVQVAEKSGR